MNADSILYLSLSMPLMILQKSIKPIPPVKTVKYRKEEQHRLKIYFRIRPYGHIRI